MQTKEAMIKPSDINFFTMNFIQALETELNIHRNATKAKQMEAYMKYNFSFLGIQAEERKAILHHLWKKHKAEIKSNFRDICWILFTKKEREFHYCGIEIIVKEINKNYLPDDGSLIEKWITTNSWWDSVDVIAKYLLGNYLLQFPDKTLNVIQHFSNADNMWLSRSAILFQLGYKKNTNFELLKSECEKHKQSNAFFIQKAIGWALKEYGKYNPIAVQNYVENSNLKPLSRKEALRNIVK